MKLQDKLIKLAIEEAKKSDHKQRIGCIIFSKKRILSKGYNSSQRSAKKLHPKFQKYPFSIHAEVDAIIKAKKNLKGSSLLVVRINNYDQLRLSKPCKICLKYINYVEIKKVFYSIDKYPYIVELIRFS